MRNDGCFRALNCLIVLVWYLKGRNKFKIARNEGTSRR